MTKFYSLILLVLLSYQEVSFAGNGKSSPRASSGPKAFEKTLMLRVKPEFRSFLSKKSFDHPLAQTFFSQLGSTQFSVKFPHRQIPRNQFYFTGERIPDMTLIYQLQYSAEVPLEEVIRQAMNTGLFEYAEPKYIREMLFTPNDPRLNQQYHIDSIHARQAWDITKGDTNVVIGIADSGVRLEHEDLAPQIKVDTSDLPNGIDDNNDGLIDNYRGWDFCGPTVDLNYPGDNNPTITQGNASHGTHVAGISAAKTNNGKGGTGVGYDCKIMPLKCAPDDGGGSIFFGYEAIEYAGFHGAAVVNCSWGGAGGYSNFEQEVITDATLTNNCLVVAAAGNDNSPDLFYPAYYDHVLAVSALGTGNVRANFTNYNYKVRVGAPGVNIMSTYFSNTYAAQSGTSMASPVVAGVAGLVKSVFPFLTPDQIAQRIRVTSDNVYTIPGNTQGSLFGKLGRGIVNAYRAVFEQSPGVKNLEVRVTDNNNDVFQPGDTLYITGDFINYLQSSSSNLKVTFSVVASNTSTYLTPITSSSEYILGEMTTNQIKNTNDKAFKVYLKPNLPSDRQIDIRMYYSDGAYYDYDHYSIILNPTYINVEKNNISTTLTSKGRIGFNNDNAAQGLGFQHKKRQTLYELGLMSGTSATKLASTVRNANTTGTTYDNDYRAVQLIRETLPPMVAQFEYSNSFSDAGVAARSSNVDIIQKSFVFTTPADSNYILGTFAIRNKGTAPLSNFYLGNFADFDISVNGQQDKASWSASEKLGYVYNTNPDGLFAGISVLGDATPNYYAIDNDATAIDTFGVYDGLTSEEKYKGLSSGLYRINAGVSGPKDVSIIIGAGPFTIPPGDTIRVGFAYVAGESLQQIQQAAQAAETQYEAMITSSKELVSSKESLKIYPNPVESELYLMGLPAGEQIRIFNTVGIEFSVFPKAEEGFHSIKTNDLKPGIYFLRTTSGHVSKFVKR